MHALPATLAEHLTPANIATALIAINFAAFAAFGIDKSRAERGAWRVAEGTLLRLALFRHKTRKQPFSGQLRSIAGLQACAAIALVIYWW